MATIEQLTAIMLANGNGDTVRKIAADVGLSKSQVWRYIQTVENINISGTRVTVTKMPTTAFRDRCPL